MKKNSRSKPSKISENKGIVALYFFSFIYSLILVLLKVEQPSDISKIIVYLFLILSLIVYAKSYKLAILKTSLILVIYLTTFYIFPPEKAKGIVFLVGIFYVCIYSCVLLVIAWVVNHSEEKNKKNFKKRDNKK